MNENRAQELVVGCLAATGVVAAGSALASGQVPGMRLVVGFAFTGAALATASMFAPDLAGSFAVLILTTSVFLYGRPLMDAVIHLTAPSPKPAPTKAGPSSPTQTGVTP